MDIAFKEKIHIIIILGNVQNIIIIMNNEIATLGIRNRIGRERNVSVVGFQLEKTLAFLNVPLILPRRSPAVHEADSLFLTITRTMLRWKKHNYKHNFFMNYKDKTQAKCLLTAITKTKHKKMSIDHKTKCLITDYCIPPCLSYPLPRRAQSKRPH